MGLHGLSRNRRGDFRKREETGNPSKDSFAHPAEGYVAGNGVLGKWRKRREMHPLETVPTGVLVN